MGTLHFRPGVKSTSVQYEAPPPGFLAVSRTGSPDGTAVVN